MLNSNTFFKTSEAVLQWQGTQVKYTYTAMSVIDFNLPMKSKPTIINI